MKHKVAFRFAESVAMWYTRGGIYQETLSPYDNGSRALSLANIDKVCMLHDQHLVSRKLQQQEIKEG